MCHWVQRSDKTVSRLFVSSVFLLEKGMRRKEKESPFLKDLAEFLKTEIFGFDSCSSQQDCFPFTSSCQKAENAGQTFFFGQKK